MIRNWQCMECGKKMTLAQAQRAASSGCSKCGGVDVDIIPELYHAEVTAMSKGKGKRGKSTATSTPKGRTRAATHTAPTIIEVPEPGDPFEPAKLDGPPPSLVNDSDVIEAAPVTDTVEAITEAAQSIAAAVSDRCAKCGTRFDPSGMGPRSKSAADPTHCRKCMFGWADKPAKPAKVKRASAAEMQRAERNVELAKAALGTGTIALASKKAVLEQREARLAAAIAADPYAKNIRALRAVATKARQEYEAFAAAAALTVAGG